VLLKVPRVYSTTTTRYRSIISTIGIGAAIARRLAKDGLNVAVNDIDAKQESLQSIVSEIRGLGREAISIPGDVGSENDVKNIVASTVARLGGLDVVCLIYL
jgi:NAD(P)-dependent dehydrogenase (short-subunit alcohol dehydrogenase family)